MTIRWTMVITDSTASIHSATSSAYRQTELAEQAADADDDQPLGALGDADVAVIPRPSARAWT